jgi:ribosome biogenesis GTPase
MHFELSDLGWSPYWEQQWERSGSDEWVPARVAAEHRGEYEVWSAVGGARRARLAGRLRHGLEEHELPGVGDWVAIDSPPGMDGPAVIQRVVDRRTVFTRGAAGREACGQVIAANVDLVFVVCGLDADFSVRRIERFVARVFASGAVPLVLLSKADLAADPQASVAEVQARAPGADVLAISSVRGEGLPGVRERIGTGITAALVGSSGAGKSTLLNALYGEERAATGAVRASDGRGCHVTTHRQLVLLPGGGLLLDTPGMRELQLLDEEGLEIAFEDVTALAARCRFADCSHGSEPGCAVRAAVEIGELDLERVEHFLQLQREARSYVRRHDERLRRQDERAWGKLSQEAHRQMRLKRGY